MHSTQRKKIMTALCLAFALSLTWSTVLSQGNPTQEQQGETAQPADTQGKSVQPQETTEPQTPDTSQDTSAQPSAAGPQYQFSLDFGNRFESNFRGSRDLYRSQLDYGEGPKLFNARFQVSVPKGSNTYFDRIEVRLNSWGREPYSRAAFRFHKDKIYDLDVDYQKVEYFNSIPQFANPFFEQGLLRSQHIFDIGQRYGRARITFLPGNWFSPYVGWDHTDRHGPVRTTLDTGGDEFLINTLYDNRSNDLRAGVNFNLGRFNLLLEGGNRYYRENSQMLASGFQPGNSLARLFGREITFNSYASNNDSTTRIPFGNGIAQWRPVDSLMLRAKVSYSMGSTDPVFTDLVSGNFFNRPMSAFYQGQRQDILGTTKRPSIYGDFSAEWAPFDRFRLVERFNTYRFHVSSNTISNSVFFQVEPLLATGIIEELPQLEEFGEFLSLNNDVQELQGMFYITPRLVARLGHRYEHREVTVVDTFEFDRNVVIAGLSYDFSMRNRISAEYEYGMTDRPIMRTDVADFQRARLRGRFSPFENLELNGSATLFDNEDDEVPEIDFTSRSRDYTLQFSYNPITRVSFSGGYERSSIRTNILYLLPQTLTVGRSRYREKGNFGNAFVSIMLIRNATLSLGYSGWGVSGDFPLNYHRPMARLEVPIDERVSLYGQWNYYDYNEKVQLFPQDYRVHHTLLGLRVNLDR